MFSVEFCGGVASEILQLFYFLRQLVKFWCRLCIISIQISITLEVDPYISVSTHIQYVQGQQLSSNNM